MDRLLTRPFVLLCIASCLGAHAPNLLTLLPRHLRAGGLGEREIGAVMGAFPLASILTMPFVARASDRLGRRMPIVAGLLLCALSCAGFELCRGFAGFFAARVGVGIGWAGVLVGGSIYVTEIAPPGRLAQALGVAGILTLLAMALGPSVGEIIVAHSSYDWLFRAGAALPLVGLAFALALPEWPRGRAARSGSRGLGLTFAPSMQGPLAATFLVSLGFGAIQSFLADFTSLHHLGGIAPFFDAYVPMAILARLTCGRLSDRVGRLPVILPALAMQALALAGLGLLRSGWQLIPAGALFGFSHGLYYPALMALTVERAAAARRGLATATFNFAFSAGIAASAFVNGFVAARAGYRAVYLLCAAAALTSMAALARRRR